jgi:hypothetical protein
MSFNDIRSHRLMPVDEHSTAGPIASPVDNSGDLLWTAGIRDLIEPSIGHLHAVDSVEPQVVFKLRSSMKSS